MGFIYIREKANEFELSPKPSLSEMIFGKGREHYSIIPSLIGDLGISSKEYQDIIQPFIECLRGFHMARTPFNSYSVFRFGSLDADGSNLHEFSIGKIYSFLLGDNDSLSIPIQDKSSLDLLLKLSYQYPPSGFENNFNLVSTPFKYKRQKGGIYLEREGNRVHKEVSLGKKESVKTRVPRYQLKSDVLKSFLREG